MSGHSKWSTIKRQKGVADARRSAMFTKLARQITIAARAGSDPDMNFKLRLAIDRARASNLPNDNVERAIRAGSGEGKEGQVKEAVYEGFGPGQVAVLVQTVTENPNRTAGDLRSLFAKFGGSLGGVNSVSWMFDLRGVIRLSESKFPSVDRDQLELELIDAGAQDVQRQDGNWVIETPSNGLSQVKDVVSRFKITPDEADLERIPTTTATIDEETRQKLYQFFEVLEEHPDVDSFASNEI